MDDDDPLLMDTTPDKKRRPKARTDRAPHPIQQAHLPPATANVAFEAPAPNVPAGETNPASLAPAAPPPVQQHSHQQPRAQSPPPPAPPLQASISAPEVLQDSVNDEDVLERPEYKQLAQLIEQALRVFESQRTPALSSLNKLLRALTAEFADQDKNARLARIEGETLVKLLLFAQQLLRPGLKIVLNAENEGLDQLLVAANAAQFALTVMVAPKMPKQVLLEDLIENCAQFVKHHLSKHIYPFCDADETAKGDGRRRRSTVIQRLGKRKKLYHQLTPLVHVCSTLVAAHSLNDQIIIDLSRFAVEAVFIDGLSDLKLEAVTLCSTIFQRYPRHRETILQEIFANLSKLTVAKRRLRTYEVREGVCIQVFSLLVMRLLQAVSSANLQGIQTDDSAAMFAAVLSTTKEVSGLIKDVVVHFSSRIEQAKSDVPYATMFQNFVEDVCTCAFQSEWPVACDVMMAIVSRMNGILRTAQAANQLRQLAFDCLMVILSTYAQAVQRAKCIHADTFKATQACMDQWREFENFDTIMAENALLAMYTEGNLPAEMTYFVVRIMGRELSASKPSDAQQRTASTITQDDSLDLAPGGNIDESDAHDQDSYYAIRQRQYHARCTFLWKFLTASPGSQSALLGCQATCDATTLLSYLQTAWYHQRWATSLNIIISKRQDRQPTVRTKAIKSLANLLVDDSPKLVQLANEAIKNHCMDVSSSVREAAIELLTALLAVHPASLDSFFPTIGTSLRDKSVAVRKRTIRLVTDMIAKRKAAHPGAIVDDWLCKLLFSLVQRVQDEETQVKDLACKPFLELWFQQHADVDDVVESMRKVYALLAAKMNSGDYMQSLFQLVIKRERSNFAVQTMAQDVAASVAERLKRDAQAGELIQLANTLCQASPRLFVSHVQHVVQYLADLVGRDAKLSVPPVVSALNLLCSSVPLCPRVSDAVLSTLERTLGRLMISGPGRALQPAAACLKASTEHSSNFKLPRDLIQTAYERLLQMLSQGPLLETTKRHSPRCLLMCGVLSRYFNLDEDDLEDKSPDRELFDDHIADVVYKMLMKFAMLSDVGLVEATVSALGHFLVQHSTLILRKESMEMFAKHLESDSERVRTRTTEALHLFLTEEERQLEQSSKTAHEGEIAQIGGTESGVSATVMAGLELHVHANATHESPQVRRATMQLLSVVQRRGLVNPMNFVDVLVAATSDGLSTTGNASQTAIQATHLLGELATRRYEFLTSRGRDAITGVYVAQKQLQRGRTIRGFVSHDGKMHALLNGLFSLYRRKVDRRHFIGGLVDASFQKNAGKPDWQLTLFAVDNLANLEFHSMDEVATAVRRIKSLAFTRATKLVMDVAASLGLDVHDDVESMTLEQLAYRVHDGNRKSFRSLMESQHVLELMLLVKVYLDKKFNVQDSGLKPRTDARNRSLRPSAIVWNPECCGVTRNYAHLESRDLIAQFLHFRKLEEESEADPSFAPLDPSSPPTSARRKASSSRSRAFSRQSRKPSMRRSRTSSAGVVEDESDEDDPDLIALKKAKRTTSAPAAAQGAASHRRKAEKKKTKHRRKRVTYSADDLDSDGDEYLQEDPDDNEEDEDWMPA